MKTAGTLENRRFANALGQHRVTAFGILEIRVFMDQCAHAYRLTTIGGKWKKNPGLFPINPHKPAFEDGDMFKVVVPLEAAAGKVTPKVAGEVSEQVGEQDTAQVAGEVTGEVAGEVTGEVLQFFRVLTDGPCTRSEAQAKLELKGQANFRDRYLVPALAADLIERTIPEKPTSRLQKYRLTPKGAAILAKMKAERLKPQEQP